ncbi:MAG TPA: DUF2254 domain-containing protein [Steroidobacteraceae bacterium]|jgi:uncharacterized membrane protein|nr:DUF2254 domain-containing protein [Steroidobacteraceae bacterium]
MKGTIYKTYKRNLSAWGIPALYAGVAMAAALIFPEHETRIFPGLSSALSVSAATAIFSSIASGMIALTGIVFSLAFVMVQFSATAYSPRLVLWIARDPVMSHALGIFTATFLYAIAALVGVDRSGSGRVPLISTVAVAVLLLASVGMFIALIQRIGLLQINRMLVFTGDQGRKVITTVYPPLNSGVAVIGPEEFQALPRAQTLVHDGAPRSIQAVDATALVNLAKESGGVIEVLAAVGDTVLQSMPLLQVLGARRSIDERKLRNGIELGEERTFEQDPKYALRLLVDIAIKALSPAVNDPTTAVQALDQIGDLLVRLGQRHLEIGAYRDSDGNLRLVVPFPTWDDLLRLAFDEILFCGATSVQVMRRMNALVNDLALAVPKERRPKIEYWDGRLKAVIARSFMDGEARLEALKDDRQGLGVTSCAPRTGN